MPKAICLIPVSPSKNPTLDQACQTAAEKLNAIPELQCRVLDILTKSSPQARWNEWIKESKYSPDPIWEWAGEMLMSSVPDDDIKLVITDVELIPNDPIKRYEIYVDDTSHPHTALLSISALDPRRWNEVGYEPRGKKIARRLFAICFRVVGLQLGLSDCQEPSCPLFTDLTSITAIDRMDSLCPYHEGVFRAKLAALRTEREGMPLNVVSYTRAVTEEENHMNEKQRTSIANTTEHRSIQPAKHLKIFLCHSSGDKPAVRELYQRLRKYDFDPWLDEESLLPGQEWQQEIPRAVRDSDVVLVCLSKRSVNKAGYLQKEIKYILDVADEQPEGTIFLIPVRLEECEVPERLRKWQWVDYFEDKGYERLSRALEARTQSIGLE